MNPQQIRWLGLAAVATTAIAAASVVRSQRKREAAEGDALHLSDPTASSDGAKIRRLPVPAVMMSRYVTQAVRVPVADEMEAMVYAATTGTYQAIRDIRWPRWKTERAKYEAGKLSLEDLWEDAAGHVAVCLAFGGDWDSQYPMTAGVRSADLVAFWFDYIARNYPADAWKQKILALAELVITRPTKKEMGWMMDYCKKLIYRLAEHAPLLGDAGPAPSLGTHPCEGNAAALARLPPWIAVRSATWKQLEIGPATDQDALGFLLQLVTEKTTVPQVGHPSEVSFDFGAFVEILGALVVLATSGQVLEMVSAARSYCAEQSSHPEGC